jgi:hypothetical protein
MTLDRWTDTEERGDRTEPARARHGGGGAAGKGQDRGQDGRAEITKPRSWSPGWTERSRYG